MIYLEDVRDYIKKAAIAENYHIGLLNSKKEKSIGVYQLKKNNEYIRAIGEKENTTYGIKPILVLVHWNGNASETEKAAMKVFEYLENTECGTLIGDKVVSFIKMETNEPIDLGTDENRIYEREILANIYYNK